MYAYVVADDGVVPFRIEGNGSMVRGQVEGSGSVALAINPDNRTLYTVEPGSDTVNGQITGFRIDPDTGALSRIDTYATGPSARSVLRHGAQIYVANRAGASVSTYTCGPDGELLEPRTQVVNSRPGAMAMDRLGELFCILHPDAGQIDSYTVAASTVPGELTFADSVDTDAAPQWVAVESRFVYVSGLTGGVSIHALGDGGSLGTASDFAAEGGGGPIVFDPLGRFAFMANRQDGAVSVFTIDPDTGLLGSQVLTLLAGTPSSLAIDPTGRFLLVTTSTEHSLAMFAIDQVTGALSWLGTSDQTGANPTQVAIVSFQE